MSTPLLGERPGYLHSLTRPELDALLGDAEHAYTVAHVRLADCPLEMEMVTGAAAVAQDCLSLWNDALHESIWRLWHGEPLG
jgi:hypothetical protein